MSVVANQKRAPAEALSALQMLALIDATAKCVLACAETIEKAASASRHNAAKIAETIEAAARSVEASARTVCGMADLSRGVPNATPGFGAAR